MIALLAAAALAGGCAEDSPCWNWASMGNHRRGVVTHRGTSLVVSPCRFQRLMRAGVVDYAASGPLKGDKLAMRVRCSR